MTAEEIRALPIHRKIQMMETLWQDLRDHFEQSELSDDLKRQLDQRRLRAAQGSVSILDWASAKDSIVPK